MEKVSTSPWLEAVGTTFMHAFWQLAAIAVLLMIVLAALPKQKSNARYWAASASLLLMLVAPFVTMLLVMPSAAAPAADATTLTWAASSASPTGLALPTRYEVGLVEQIQAFFVANADRILFIWLIGAAVLSLRLSFGFWQVRTLRRKDLMAVEPELMDRFVSILNKMGVTRQAQIFYSGRINTPMVVGAFKPMVLLPAQLLTGLSEEQLNYILIHEVAHIKRWDYLINIIQHICEILLFFHPAIWWTSKVIREERENCCDAAVLAQKGNKVQYARALLNLELIRKTQPVMAIGAAKGPLGRRIMQITGAKHTPDPRFYSRGFAFGFMTLIALLIFATQSPTVIKAAFPFLANPHEQDENCLAEDKLDKVTPGDQANGQSPKTPAFFVSTAQDSPISKVILNDRGDQVEISFNGNGDIKSVTRNGKEVSAEEQARYQEMARAFFSPSSRGAMPPLPPMPPLPSMPAMPPMPPMPGAPVPPLPAMPPFPPMAHGDSLQMKEFESAMDQFGKAMEKWGESLEKQFNNADWGNFEKEMERWGQGLAFHFLGEDDAEMKALHEKIERLQRKAETADAEDREDIQDELNELHDELSALHEEALDRRTDEIEERAESWANEYAAKMEQWAEHHAQKMEDLARKWEEDAEKSRSKAEREAEKADDAADVIGKKLAHDGLISSPSNYKFKINRDELYVNGEKQPASTHKKYKALTEELMDLKLDNDFVTIHRR